MSIEFKRKIIVSNRSLMINIPHEIAEQLQMQKGDVVVVTLENNTFKCRKISQNNSSNYK